MEVTDLALEGRGVARHAGLVLFVEGALPGERARVRLRRVRRRYADADLIAILRGSPGRVEPLCPHFGVCGGCDRQHLDPREQTARRTAQVRGTLERLAGVDGSVVREAVAPPDPWRYRFRMDFDWRPSSDGPRLGLHGRRDAVGVVAIERCLLAGEATGEILRWLPAAAAARGLTAFDPARGRGLLRRLSVQEARGTGEILLTFDTGRGDPAALLDLVEACRRRFPRIVGVVRRRRESEDRPWVASIESGRAFLHEELEGDRFTIPAEAFFQPNPLACLAVRRTAVEACHVPPGGALLELFAGVGFFTVGAARRGARVTAVEGSEAACAAGRENLAANGITGCRFVHGDVTAQLPRLLEAVWDSVLLDPPRTGLPPQATDALAGSAATRLVYVSCDPATLARDLARLRERGGFQARAVTPFDLFPQTQHVECVAEVERPARR